MSNLGRQKQNTKVEANALSDELITFSYFGNCFGLLNEMYWFNSLQFFQESWKTEQMARNNHLLTTFPIKSHC